MKLTALKFGGTSLADGGQFKKVKAIIESDESRRFVVASAPGKRFCDDIKVTDMLYDALDRAEAGDDFAIVLRDIKKRFQDIMDEIGVKYDINHDIDTIGNALKIGASRSYMASRGEYLNSKILAAYLGFEFVDPATCIFFDENKAGEPVLNRAKTKKALTEKLSGLDAAVVAGFYGSKADGSIQTFSRGGSDVTGSLVAEAIGADIYENWTDVSGLLAADPRIVNNPRSVEYITYRELRILSYMGASVLHTDAVYPASQAGIPINIRNTNRPEDPGTMIVNSIPEGVKSSPISGVTGFKGLSVIQVEKIMVSDGAGFTAIMLDIFKRLGIPFEQCLTGIDTVSVVVRSKYLEKMQDEVLELIDKELDPDHVFIKENMAMIAVVGESNADSYDAIVQLINAVDKAGIEIRTINQGAGNLNLLMTVREEDYEKTIYSVYNAL